MRKRGVSALTMLLALAALLIFAAGPAFAHHKDGHDHGGNTHAAGEPDGDADSDDATAHTEDSDSDGVANCNDATASSHPSGKDRYCEQGGNINQGNSESDPDDDGHGPDRSNGGPDKPNGTGGEDIYDQDGNNGCGNDQDFEDDNEGRCGKPEDDVTVEGDEVEGDEVEGDEVEGDHDNVLGVIINRASGNDVLGSTLNKAPATVGAAGAAAAPGGVLLLPFTGAELLPFAAFGVGMIGAGTALVRRKR